MTDRSHPSTVSRRSLLASGVAIGMAATAGCVREARNIAGRDRREQLTLEIKTPPSDNDPFALRIANHVAEHLEAIGIHAQITPLEIEELYRQVLINHNFDLYVSQFSHPPIADPDVLFPLTHSSFDSEPGWQNPFGYTDLNCDDLLVSQRTTTGADRLESVMELQQYLSRTQPFVPIAFPDTLTAVRNTRFTGWRQTGPTDPMSLLLLSSTDDHDGESRVRLVITDARITVNRNPIAAEFRQHGLVSGLLYDSLVRYDRSDQIPWLAESITWNEDDEQTSATVTLRENLTWHDDTDLTAADVAFTYEFYADTSLGRTENPLPTARYRGRSSLVTDVHVTGQRTVLIEFSDAVQEVAETALTLPILPEHIWSEKTGGATIAGIEVDTETTEALVWNNPEPVGSGPFEFVSANDGVELIIARNPNHFLQDVSESDPAMPDRFVGAPRYEELSIEPIASDNSALEMIATDDADATLSNVSPDLVPRIGRESDVRLITSRSRSFYHLGFNTRVAPLGNPHFRRAVARVIDKAGLVEDAFSNYAVPIASILADTEWLDPALSWEGEDPTLPFFATDEGELDADAAREMLRTEGFQYNDEGELTTVGR